MEKLIIDRTKWRTGADGEFKTGEGKTSLLNDLGFMCCLGFECLRRGLKREEILSEGDPVDVFYSTEAYQSNELAAKFGSLLTDHEDEEGDKIFENSEFVNKAININDDEKTTREEKEKLLLDLFAGEGIEIEFIN